MANLRSNGTELFRIESFAETHGTGGDIEYRTQVSQRSNGKTLKRKSSRRIGNGRWDSSGWKHIKPQTSDYLHHLVADTPRWHDVART